jgi:uncharacterized protein (DUF2141 family)
MILPVLTGLSLKVSFDELRSEKGNILYLLFQSEEGYPDQEKLAIRQGKIPASTKSFVLSELPAGEYAMTFIHDENANGKLDTNFFGIPKEGYGFSNNPKAYFGPPSYGKSKFELKEESEIHIKMSYL